jgi:hypothetical protein
MLRSTCAACGPVEVPIADAELLLDLDAVSSDARDTVMFDCPQCSLAGSSQVDERGVRLLMAAGIRVAVSPARSREIRAGEMPSARGADRG